MNATAPTPEVFIVGAGTVATALGGALRHAGVPVEAHLFQKGQHGLFLLPRDRWQGAIMTWLTDNGWLWPRASK